ncbi:MAG: ATP-binding cassette domain-containing protein [Gaiellaceae bacterium]
MGLIGANGAGKSTTLNAVMGLAPTSAGDIRLGADRSAGALRSGRAQRDRARARGPPHLLGA